MSGVDELPEGVVPGEDLVSEEIEYESRKKLHWCRRPSAVWLLVAMPFVAATMSSTTAARIEIITTLACNSHRPEYSSNHFVPRGFLDSPFMSPRFAFDEVHFNDSFRTAVSTHTGDGEEKRKLCAADPVVQVAVAKLLIAMAVSMGILSCLTTGWWGGVSDRRGRAFVLGMHMIGLLLTDFSFIFASHFAQHIPGGYWFLLLGPIIEGALGGFTGAGSAANAYLADCTTGSSRSGIFSLLMGLIFIGMAVGPTLGGLLIRATEETLSVFYAATVVHLCYIIFLCIFLPESLSKAQMLKSQVKYRETQGAIAREWEESPGGVLARARRAFRFFSPLGIFWPHLEKNTNPLKGRSRDWNLTLLVLAYGFVISLMGSQTTKFQYAASTYGWNSEILGYWLSIVGVTRAVHLTFILPLIIKYSKPKLASVQPPEPSESTRLLTPSSSTHAVLKPATQEPEVHSAAFDLGLARVSVVIDVISYTLMAVISTPVAFTVFSMTGALGMGFSPAVYSVALDLYAKRGGMETGRLFGALSVVQALCSEILGPAMFGFTYMKTVETFPRAFFYLVAVVVTAALICLSFIRLGNASSAVQDTEDVLADRNATETMLVGGL